MSFSEADPQPCCKQDDWLRWLSRPDHRDVSILVGHLRYLDLRAAFLRIHLINTYLIDLKKSTTKPMDDRSLGLYDLTGFCG